MKADPTIRVSVKTDLDEATLRLLADRSGERRVKYAAMVLAAWLGGIAGLCVWLLS